MIALFRLVSGTSIIAEIVEVNETTVIVSDPIELRPESTMGGSVRNDIIEFIPGGMTRSENVVFYKHALVTAPMKVSDKIEQLYKSSVEDMIEQREKNIRASEKEDEDYSSIDLSALADPGANVAPPPVNEDSKGMVSLKNILHNPNKRLN
jgi:hypothetical protein